ncbi:MAG TPA: EAL domain-containing protein [Alicyclobacillus sp.]|nr:EAL domain-containing protein [Alicyclobacillus sp.]
MNREVIAQSQHVYQPIVHLASGEVAGYEALVRGPADLGLSSPLQLFQWAEDQGIAEQLDVALFPKAVEGAPPGRVFVNVRASTLANYGERVVEHLREVGGHRVTVEITEQAAVKDLVQLERVVDQIHRTGAKVALDDVGSGYASLEWLLHVRPDVLKMDMVFTRAAVNGTWAGEIIRSLARLSSTVGAMLVAEGIETREMCGAVSNLGVEWGQGYLFSRPAPASAFIQ